MFKFLNKKKKEPENLKEILAQFKDLKENFEIISQELENLKKENKFSVQKIGMVRFNPFRGVGSDQSFSVALLDANDSGVVITSLYAREESRIYGKPVKAGQSEYLLSEEEKKAINKAKAEPERARREMKNNFSANNGNNNSKNGQGGNERGGK